MSTVPDIQFPTDNWMDIPVLPLDAAAEYLTLPVLTWGATRPGRSRMGEGGTWHFYTTDDEFEHLWERPERLIGTRAGTMIEPNHSVYDQTPLAVATWATHRKRWLACFAASRGMKILVDLNVAAPYSELNLVGVPRGWPSYATRGYADRLEDLSREYSLARDRAEGDPRLFVVYAGGRAVRALCQDRGWIYVEERNRAAKKGLAALQEVRLAHLPQPEIY